MKNHVIRCRAGGDSGGSPVFGIGSRGYREPPAPRLPRAPAPGYRQPGYRQPGDSKASRIGNRRGQTARRQSRRPDTDPPRPAASHDDGQTPTATARRSGADGVADELDEPVRRPGDGERGDAVGRGGGDPAAELVVGDDAVDGGGEPQGVLVGRTPGAADGLGDGGDAVGDDGHAVAHGLDERDAEPLVVGGADEDVGGLVVGLEVGGGDGAGDGDVVVEAEVVDEAGERGTVLVAER